MRASHSSFTIALSFLRRGALSGLLTLASSLPVGGCGGKAQDSGDGDGNGDGDNVGDGDGDGDSVGDGDALPASLNPDDLLVSLNTTEIGTVCDTVAEMYGGYGETVDCGDGITASSSPSKEACIADSDLPSTCTATVGDALSCGESVSETCAFTDAGCLALFSCVN